MCFDCRFIFPNWCDNHKKTQIITELDKKYDINIVITDYSCAKTDSQAEGYDLYSLDEKYDMHNGRNVVISRDSLQRMKTDPRFRAKVIKSIEDMPWRGRMTGGIVKSTGVFIHEAGTFAGGGLI